MVQNIDIIRSENCLPNEPMDHEPTQNESYNESLIDFPRTVINDFDESMEFIDSRTQIPSGNSISF